MKDFKDYFIIKEQPQIVYKALVNPLIIKLWTGFNAVMSENVGEEFNLYDDSVVGQNLVIEPNKLIEQEWYFGEQEEPSIVTIKLHEHKKGTSLEFKQTNIPEEFYENIVDGIVNIYMADLQDFYDGE